MSECLCRCFPCECPPTYEDRHAKESGMRKIDCGHLFEVLALLALLAGFWYGAVKLVVWIHPVSRLWP